MPDRKTVFEGKANRLSYALSKVNDPRAIAALAEVIAGGTLSEEEMGNAISTVASLGTPEQVGALLAFVEESPHWLPALARGVAFNQIPPLGKERAIAFLGSKTATVRSAAASLCGAWKLTEARSKLRGAATSTEDAGEVLVMCSALAKMGAREELVALSGPGNSGKLRAAAVTALAGLDPEGTAAGAAMVLSGLDDPLFAQFIVEAFLSREEGPAALSKALAGVKLPEEIAVAGSRTGSASGRNVPELLAALDVARQEETAASLVVTMTSESIPEIPWLLDFAAEQGVLITFQPVMDHGHAHRTTRSTFPSREQYDGALARLREARRQRPGLVRNSLGALGGFVGSYLVGWFNGLTQNPASSFLLMGTSLMIAVVLLLLPQRPSISRAAA